MIFFLTLTFRGPFYSEKNIWGYGVNYYSVPLSKNYQNIRSRCLVHKFFFIDIFNDINQALEQPIGKAPIPISKM